ncbi:hypothetical protein [Streptomyces sp. LN245]|uniref:hypothetical protein n=1 Tax=Streptomyces sp. LN245 TaxID=3112975 RepID=UPI0037208234
MSGQRFVAHGARIGLAAPDKVRTPPWDTRGTGTGGSRQMTDTARERYGHASPVACDDAAFGAAQKTVRAGRGAADTEDGAMAPFDGPREAILR